MKESLRGDTLGVFTEERACVCVPGRPSGHDRAGSRRCRGHVAGAWRRVSPAMRSERDKEHRERRDVGAREKNHDLIGRLRREATIRDADLEALRARLDAAEHELEDLRAIRDALTPFELPRAPRNGLGRRLRARRRAGQR